MHFPQFHIPVLVRNPLRLAPWVLVAAGLVAPGMAADVALAGLVPTKAGSFDKAWLNPGANLGTYDAVLIRPVTVAFSRNWRPRDYGSFGLGSADVERIRSTYASAAERVFARGLSRAGLRVATTAGANVLEMQAEVVDLYVNGPDDTSDALVRRYVRSAGDMRLVVTLRDSATGKVLFHGNDFRRGDESGGLEWASSVYNRTEAERVFTGWARQLQRLLEK